MNKWEMNPVLLKLHCSHMRKKKMTPPLRTKQQGKGNEEAIWTLKQNLSGVCEEEQRKKKKLSLTPVVWCLSSQSTHKSFKHELRNLPPLLAEGNLLRSSRRLATGEAPR